MKATLRCDVALSMSGQRQFCQGKTCVGPFKTMNSSLCSSTVCRAGGITAKKQLGCAALMNRRQRANPKFMVKALVDASEDTFENEVLKADLPVLVDFWATWCGPCKLVAPSMVWADKEFSGQLKVVKIDCTDKNKKLMEQYKVYGLPCLIIFKDGVKVEESHHEGAITKKALAKYLEEHVGLKAAAL